MRDDDTFKGLVGRKIPVLDQGWIMVNDVMGSDQTIVDRARGTHGGKPQSSDRDLIRLMMRKDHGSSFEFPEIDVEICTTFVVWRQMIRHRAGNILDEMSMWDEPSVNELSGRYSKLPEMIQETPADGWRQQSKANRQGSGERFISFEGAEFSALEAEATKWAMDVYSRLVKEGVAKEQARKVYPMGGYTIGSMKMDLRNWLHWLALRLAPDAQEEIREYARPMFEQIMKPLFPIAAEAFEDYLLGSIRLTRLDIIAIERALSQKTCDPFGHIDNKREREECLAKLKRLGIT